MSFKYRYRKQIIVALVFFVVFLVTITNMEFTKEKKKVASDEIVLEKKEKKEEQIKKEDNKEIMVDVKGEVVNQGIYKLSPNSRVIDAINMAGGVTKNGDTSIINLSKKLKDEMVIIIYSYYEVRNFERTKETEQKVLDNCVNGYDNVKNDACISNSNVSKTNEDNNSIININEANIEQLQTLPGVGEAKAKNIIEYRNKSGLFNSIEDIKNVTGIGEALFEKIKSRISV